MFWQQRRRTRNTHRHTTHILKYSQKFIVSISCATLRIRNCASYLIYVNIGANFVRTQVEKTLNVEMKLSRMRRKKELEDIVHAIWHLICTDMA